MSIVSDSISVAEKVQEIAKKYKDKELNNEIIALQQCWNKDRKLSIMPNHGIKEFDGINEYAFECPACGYIVYSKDNFTNTTKNDTQPK